MDGRGSVVSTTVCELFRHASRLTGTKTVSMDNGVIRTRYGAVLHRLPLVVSLVGLSTLINRAIAILKHTVDLGQGGLV